VPPLLLRASICVCSFSPSSTISDENETKRGGSKSRACEKLFQNFPHLLKYDAYAIFVKAVVKAIATQKIEDKDMKGLGFPYEIVFYCKKVEIECQGI
jgi:hypothetical protein